MTLQDWNDTLFAYCSANTYAPEELKAALERDPGWARAFHAAHLVALGQGVDHLDWGWEDFALSHADDADFGAWLEAMRAYLFEDGPEPRADG